jgi:hypothetical protein
LHDIAEFLNKECIAGLYLRDDGTGGLHMWARNGELVGHGPIVRPGEPQPPVRIVKNPAFKYVDPDADDEEAEEAQKLKPAAQGAAQDRY